MLTRRRFLLSALARHLESVRLGLISPFVLAAGPVLRNDDRGDVRAGEPAIQQVPQSTPQSPSPGSDFAARSVGSLRAWDFSKGIGSPVTSGTVVPFPSVLWYRGDNGNPTLDTVTGLACVRFDVPGKSGSNAAGEWAINFSENLGTQFDSGDEFFVQWRQRFNAAYMTTYLTGATRDQNGNLVSTTDPTAIKQVIISSQDTPTAHFDSCTELEIVVTSYLQHRMPFVYQACGWADPLVDRNPLDGNDFRLQNAMPAPYCTMYGAQKVVGGDRGTVLPPGCFGYVADEWMTFQVGVKLGRRDNTLNRFVGSRVRLWGAREGKPSLLLIDMPYDIHSGTAAANQRYGKAWFGPYTTSKDPAIDHPTMTTWVGEFIVSRNPILDPVVLTFPSAASPAPTAAPTSLSTLAPGRVRKFAAWSDGSVASIARTDYSGTAIGNGHLYLFGGAHGPGVNDDIRAFDLTTFQWASLYPPTPAAAMVASNQDATFGRWISTNNPMVRHTYNAQVVIGRKFYLITAGGGSEYPAGTVCWYDLDAKAWSYSKIGHPDWYFASAAAVDPVSGKCVIVGTDTGASNWCHVWLYDPIADTAQKIADVTVGLGYMFDLLYLPQRDSFLAIQANNTLWEIKLNRATSNASISVVTPSGQPPAAVFFYPARWRWNGRLLAGCIIDGKLSTLDPATWQWGSVQMLNEDGTNATMQQAYYCLDFDSSSGCYVFLARDGNTYAARL